MSVERPGPKQFERTPNPEYSESDYEQELEAHKQRAVARCMTELEKELDPEWRKVWEGLLEDTEDREAMEWRFIHEFTRLMPAGLDRELGVIDSRLAADLDQVFREHYDYDQYVAAEERRCELVRTEWKRKLTRDEADELEKIKEELAKIDLKMLYMEMRKLGYTPKDLKTNLGSRT